MSELPTTARDLAKDLGARFRALLQFLSTLNPEDRECVERLIAINGSAEIPLLLKCDPPMLPCPPDAPWRAKFEAAVAPLRKALWQEAAESSPATARIRR